MAKINNNKSDDSLNTFSPKGINIKRLGAAKKKWKVFIFLKKNSIAFQHLK